MAELDIGQHCSWPECKQLDFLPITCSLCGLVFCKLHSNRDSHDCSVTLSNKNKTSSSADESYCCQFAGCGKAELTPITCPSCEKNFCLAHRHQSDHACKECEKPAQKMTNTSQHIRDILQKSAPADSKSPPKKRLSKKARETAARVNLMKLKMKATGMRSIPEMERIFFNVHLPMQSQCKAKALFVSRLWSVGRVVDALASEMNLTNNNNAVGSEKLKLFDAEGIQLRADKTLESYLAEKDVLFNGSDVILEYVHNDVNQLNDVSPYVM